MIPKKFLYPSSPQVRVKLLKMSLRENAAQKPGVMFPAMK